MKQVFKEIWRDIPNYEGYYQVSNLGNVRSVEYTKITKDKEWVEAGRILKPHDAQRGYLQVKLYKDGVKKNFSIHRLVAMAFIPNPNNLPEVNHKDENSHNNNVDNLEWCTAKYNSNYGSRGSRIWRALRNVNGIPVVMMVKFLPYILVWRQQQRKLGARLRQ